MRNRIFFISIATLMLLQGCSGSNSDKDASGVFETTEVVVSAEANGKLLEWNVEEGETVTAGALLGKVDTVQLDLKRQQLQASHQAALSRKQDVNKQLAALEEQLVTARREYARLEKLFKAGVANQKQLDDASAQVSVVEKQLIANQTTMESLNKSISEEAQALQIQMAQVVDQLHKCRITSPINGVVLNKYAEAGELCTAGKPLFKVADLTKVNLKAYVTAPQLTKIKLGDKVKVYADLGEDESKAYEGNISWISDQAEFTPKTIQTRDERANLVYAVKISVQNDGTIKLGMYGDVKF